jgi:ElaB/YqjD/DUF883 family membrane-anchored ribosome-binding protein
MAITEALFHQLIQKTEDLIRIFRTSLESEAFKEADHLFAERESLLKQLRENLQHIANIDKYEPLYASWQSKEAELLELIKSSMQVLKLKKMEFDHARTITKNYNSYLRQMPYGAFLDKKK